MTVSILLLVIPLLLHDLFLYRQEYRERLQAAQSYLQAIGQERALLIEGMIKMVNGEIERQGGEPTAGCSNDNVKPLYIEKIPMPQGVGDDFVLLDQRRKALLIGQRESAYYALIMAVPLAELLQHLPEPYPVEMALTEGRGKGPEADVLRVEQPIRGTNLFLQLSLPMDHIQGLQKRQYLFRLVSLLLFVGGIGGAAVALLTRRIARPLKNLSRTMERVQEGASHARYTPDWMGFEINELGKQFNETMEGWLRHAQQAERERIAREKLAEEWRIGHAIQARLFPSHVPGLPGVDIATGNLPAREVNGDFYDLFHLESGKLLLVVSDVAGKGIAACLYALGLRSLIRSFASTSEKVEEIVRKTNDLFWLDAHESSLFATLWLGLYDPKTRMLEFCSQGHPPALLQRGESLQELWTNGIALGAQKTAVIPTKKIQLTAGDLLLLYTDGIIEAHDPYNQLFGQKRLHDFLLRKKRERPQKIVDELIEEVHLFSQGSPQHDDMTLVVVKISD